MAKLFLLFFKYYRIQGNLIQGKAQLALNNLKNQFGDQREDSLTSLEYYNENKFDVREKKNSPEISQFSKFCKSGSRPPIWTKTSSIVLYSSGDQFNIKKFVVPTSSVFDIFDISRRENVVKNVLSHLDAQVLCISISISINITRAIYWECLLHLDVMNV